MPSNRREFLRCTGWAGLGLTGLAALPLPGCGGYRLARFSQNGSRISVARIELADDPFVLVRLYSLPAPIYLARTAENDYSALLLLCSHKQCEVNPGGDRLVCPCHGSEYSTTGQVLNPPAERPLHSFPVTLGANEITIDIGETGSQP